MKHPGTIAPKERINIVYQQAGDSQAQVELPLKLLVMGNYGGNADPRLIEERKPIGVNKDNFNRVMQQHQLKLDLCVEDELRETKGAQLPLSLRFQSLSDFGPESIVAQCPELSALMQLRSALTALKGPMGNIPAFRQRLRELLHDEHSRTQLLAEVQTPALASAQDEEEG